MNVRGSTILFAGDSQCEPGVDIILREGVTCFQIFRRRKLVIRFRQDASSSNELIGYVELTEFREIWPERQLNNEEQKGVGIFVLIKYTSLVAASERNTFSFFLILQLDRSIKRKPIGIRGNAHTL